MSKIDIEDIDFNNKKHQILIMTLSKKNKYHIETLSTHIMRKIPNNILTALLNKEMVLTILKNENAFYADDSNYKGFILFINKKAIGFIIFYRNEVYDTLLYLLIDKEYQSKGYGSILLKFLITNTIQNTKLLIKLKEKDIENYTFYKKLGFEYGNEIIDKIKNDNDNIISTLTLQLCNQEKKSLYYRIIK